MARRKSRGPSLKNLQAGAHSGRRSKALRPSNGKPFVSANGLAKLTAPAMMHKTSPTPHGPEPHYPAG